MNPTPPHTTELPGTIFRWLGAITGALSSIVVTILVKNYTSLHWYGYMPAAVFACIIIGYVVSLLTPRRSNDLTGLTVFDINRDLGADKVPAARLQS